MKKFIVFLILLFANFTLAINIPFADNNFKLKLLSASTSNNVALNQVGVSIVIDINGDSEITDLEALAVYQLDVSNAIPSVASIDGVQYFTNLQILNCENNLIGFANLTAMSSLMELNIGNNVLNALNLTGCTNLETLNVSNNNLLSTIDFSSLVNLNSVQASSCSFSTIDVSWCFHLLNMDLSNNALTSLNIKNGINEIIDLSGVSNNNLTYICADENQVPTIEASVSSLPNCSVNSYCTFPPGGNYNKITGQAVFDILGNGIDITDTPQPYLKLNSVFGGQNFTTVSNASGNFDINIQDVGGYSITPVLENPSWFTITPSAGNFVNTNDNVSTFSFNILSSGIHHDVEVVITPINTAQPGLPASYKVVYKNKGNQNRTGLVNLSFDSALLTFVSSTMPLTLNLNVLSLPYLNLKPFETRTFNTTFNVSSSAVLNTIINFNANIDTTGESASSQEDNSFNYREKVTNSDNANSIKCLEGDTLDPSEIGKYLHYQIYFENTGTQTANNVVIKHVIDESIYDYNSLQIMETSHEMKMKSRNNTNEYYFENIAIGGPGGQGGVLLKIQSNPNLQPGESVNQNVSIYFDYDNPLITNDEVTTYQVLKVDENLIDNSISVYPNPSKSILNINSQSTILTIQLYDINGRLLQTELTNKLTTSIDISQRQNGVYFLKMFSENGIKLQKIIKE